MKKQNNSILKKVRVRTNQEIYYTYSHWPTKEIDGIEFIAVTKQAPSNQQTQSVHLMRKDSLEYVK
jgi:hypothetical protein